MSVSLSLLGTDSNTRIPHSNGLPTDFYFLLIKIVDKRKFISWKHYFETIAKSKGFLKQYELQKLANGEAIKDYALAQLMAMFFAVRYSSENVPMVEDIFKEFPIFFPKHTIELNYSYETLKKMETEFFCCLHGRRIPKRYFLLLLDLDELLDDIIMNGERILNLYIANKNKKGEQIEDVNLIQLIVVVLSAKYNDDLLIYIEDIINKDKTRKIQHAYSLDRLKKAEIEFLKIIEWKMCDLTWRPALRPLQRRNSFPLDGSRPCEETLGICIDVHKPEHSRKNSHDA